jgi:hypothetical protein
MRDIVTDILVPHVKAVIDAKGLPNAQHSILILDVRTHHVSEEFRAFLASLDTKILLNFIPPNCTSKAQGTHSSCLSVSLS